MKDLQLRVDFTIGIITYELGLSLSAWQGIGWCHAFNWNSGEYNFIKKLSVW